MQNKIYKNLAIISVITATITFIILSLLFYDFDSSNKIQNLKVISNLASLLPEDVNIDELSPLLEDNINLKVYEPNSLPSKDSSYLYYDLKLNNSNILRATQLDQGISYILMSGFPVMVSIIIFLLIILYLASSILTSKIIIPIKNASQSMESILSGELVEEVETYDELNPFIRNIDIYKEQINHSMLILKEAEKIRREFTANVSHELKTPLTSINGFAEMIESGIAKDEDIVKFASIIRAEGTRLLTLIDSIIELSQYEDISIPKELRNIDLLNITNSVVDNMKYRLAEKNINIKVSGVPTIINGNERMIKDLIFNLIDNSIKYNRDMGKINIEISQLDKWALFSISDTGIGISPKYQSRVFERFYRIDKSRSKRINGTGLGLSIVKHIVQYHYGKVNISSEENVGTTIKINFPKVDL